MKVTPKRNFFGGFKNDGTRINYKRGQVYDLHEKTIQEFPNDFVTDPKQFEALAKLEAARDEAKKPKETADGSGGKKSKKETADA